MSAQHDKFIEYLNSECEADLDNYIDNLIQNCTAAKTHSAQSLTRMYDEQYARLFRDSLFSLQKGYGSSKLNEMFPENAIEVLYLCFTYLRRENKMSLFVKFYEALVKKMSETYLDDELLQSFRFYYIKYKYLLLDSRNSKTDYNLLTENNMAGEENLLFVYCNATLKVSLTTKVTVASFIFDILVVNKDQFYIDKKQFSQYYFKALRAIEDALSEIKDYALYYFIKANIQMLGIELDLNNTPCDEIRLNIKKAIELENSTESGLRKKTEYLSKLSELNMIDIEQRNKESEDKIKEMEANSIKKFSAFSAFVTFAVGLLGKFAWSGGVTTFNETVGYIFLLFGIAVAIFAVFDLLVLGPLSSLTFKKSVVDENYNLRLLKNKNNLLNKTNKIAKLISCFRIRIPKEVKRFLFKAAIEIIIVAAFITLGCLIGKGIILK